MPQRNIKVRVRPARIVVLVNQESTSSEFLLAVKFLSGIWGGRYARFILVQEGLCDSETSKNLTSLKPDYVYGIGINDEYWHGSLLKVCQPRIYRSLSQGIISHLSDSFTPEANVSINLPLVHRHDHLRHTFKNRDEALAVVGVKSKTKLSAICQTYFGMHPEDLDSALIDRTEDFSGNSSLELVEAMVRYAKSGFISWLDLSGHELRLHTKGFRYHFPIIVLVAEGSIRDLTHFWNIRSSREWEYSISVLPVPIEVVSEMGGIDLIAQWLELFSNSKAANLGCTITSRSLPKSLCERIAESIASSIAERKRTAAVTYSDVSRLPIVVPYEYEATWSVNMKGRALVADPPKSRAFLDVGGVRGSFVDLLKDIGTGRAVGNLSLPLSPVIKDLLNGACPPYIEERVIPRAGVGADGISLHCYSHETLVRQYLPSSSEVLSEMLREHGVFAVHDEKRKVYVPLIKKMGGLQAASQAMRGRAGEILHLLVEGERIDLDEIKKAVGASGHIFGDRENDSQFADQKSDRIRRINKKRMRQYKRSSGPKGSDLVKLLDHWSDIGLVKTECRFEPCTNCGKQSFASYLAKKKRYCCSYCPNVISTDKKMKRVYTLRQSPKFAIREGVRPVVLTGSFLQNSTSSGFIWLPGFKYRKAGEKGDLDIVALCDGHLVFAECKSLIFGEKIGNGMEKQFLRTISLAGTCGASLAVFASLMKSYSDDFVERVQAAAKTCGVKTLLLTKHDLESGYRERPDEKGYLRLWDFLELGNSSNT